MLTIKQIIALIIALLSFVYTFLAMGKFMLFLSSTSVVDKEYVWILNLLDGSSRREIALKAVSYDFLFTAAFILQHTFMKAKIVKGFIHKLGLGVAERALYSLVSALCLLSLVESWEPAHSIVLWQVDVSNGGLLYWMFIGVHSLAWMIIYMGCIIMDLPEILGIKQVYYDIQNFGSPMSYKSSELRHLYGNVRHPSFVGFTTLLWFRNLMSVDRLLLALLLTVYMLVAWSTDHNDVTYQKRQLLRKWTELKHKRS